MKLKKVKIGFGYHFIATCKLNDFEVDMIVDTGASMTLFDSDQILPKLSQSVIGMSKPIEGIGGTTSQISTCKIDYFQVERVVLKGKVFSMTSLKNLNKQYTTFGLKTIQGILGSDILSRHHAFIDLFREEMILTKP